MKQTIIALVLIASALQIQAWPRGGGGHASRTSRSTWAGAYHADGMGTWHGGSNHNKGWGSAGRSNFGR